MASQEEGQVNHPPMTPSARHDPFLNRRRANRERRMKGRQIMGREGRRQIRQSADVPSGPFIPFALRTAPWPKFMSLSMVFMR